MKQNYETSGFGKPPVYFLTFPGSPRLPRYEELKRQYPELKLFLGCPASLIGDARFARLTSSPFHKLWIRPKRLLRGEVACYLTHLLFLKHMVDLKLNSSVVIEDDGLPDFEKLMPFTTELQKDPRVTFCSFCSNHDNRSQYLKTSIYKTINGIDLKISQTGLMGAVGLYLTQNYARRRLKECFPIFRPVDSYYHLSGPRPFLFTVPSLVGFKSMESLIASQSERKLVGKASVIRSSGKPITWRLPINVYQTCMRIVLRVAFWQEAKIRQELNQFETEIAALSSAKLSK